MVIGYQPDGTVTAIMDGDYANRLTGTATANQVFGESNGYMTLGGTVGGTGYAPNADYDEVAIYNLSSLTGTQFQTKLQDLAGHYSATGGPEPSTLVLLATGLIGLLAYACARENSSRPPLGRGAGGDGGWRTRRTCRAPPSP